MTLGFLSGSRNFCKLLWVSCEVSVLHEDNLSLFGVPTIFIFLFPVGVPLFLPSSVAVHRFHRRVKNEVDSPLCLSAVVQFLSSCLPVRVERAAGRQGLKSASANVFSIFLSHASSKCRCVFPIP